MGLVLCRAVCLLVVATGSVGSAKAAEIRYVCDDRRTLAVAFTAPASGPGSARLSFPDAPDLTLPQIVSADGERYADGDTEFWIKGQAATLTRSGAATACRTGG
jgi:membrane-bound inhibitor of C-type lysozyme